MSSVTIRVRCHAAEVVECPSVPPVPSVVNVKVKVNMKVNESELMYRCTSGPLYLDGPFGLLSWPALDLSFFF